MFARAVFIILQTSEKNKKYQTCYRVKLNRANNEPQRLKKAQIIASVCDGTIN